MIINEINEEECRAVLERGSIGRLGCSLNDQPYVTPVYFAWEPGCFYVLSTVGQKINWMRQNPRVCMQVDAVAAPSKWVSVIATGTYEEIPGPEDSAERAHARKLLEEKHHKWWAGALAERRAKVDDLLIEPVLFRIVTDAVTGLRATE